MRAKKSFGQHFLTDEHVVQRIADAVELEGVEVVVEIGPGTGVLTEKLRELNKELVLIEADRDLIPDLQTRFPSAKLIQADAAKVDYAEFVQGRSWLLIGNLPYNASAAILANAIERQHPPERMVIMVQKEQGDRIRAEAGQTSLLSIAVQLRYRVRLGFHASPGAFNPPPKVDSSVLLLEKKSEQIDLEQYRTVMRLAKAGFRARRKQLHKNISAVNIADSERVKSALEQMKVSTKARPQELTAEQWIELAKKLY